MRALQSVQPIENWAMKSQISELSHAIETFTIQLRLSDFTKSFEELETEYQRLLADKEINSKILNYEN